MAGDKSIRDFFAPKQTQAAPQSSLPNSNLPSSRAKSTSQLESFNYSVTKDHSSSFSSNLSSPLSSNNSASPTRTVGRSILDPAPGFASSGREVRGSDDEEDDSDSSLEELQTIFATKSSTVPNTKPAAPSTPTAKRIKTTDYNLNVSPLAILPKYRSDLKSLVKLAQHEKETEESAQRVKAMEADREEQEEIALSRGDIDLASAKLSHGSLLESVVAQKEEGGLRKVTRALMRTEATSVQKHWSFFSTENEPPKSKREAFPSRSVPKSWRDMLGDPEIRHQTFVSGYAEDMVALGNSLPDELFIWILNDASFEQDDVLRASYYNTLRVSAKEQTSKLVTPAIIENMFRSLGANQNALLIEEEMTPVPGRNSLSQNHDWSPLRSFALYLVLSAHALGPESRELAICLLIRMLADSMVYKNIDLLDSIQTTVRYLCKYIEDGVWEASCQKICKLIFKTVKIATMCLQIVEALPSTTPRIHDLRRRLALCYFYGNESHSEQNPHYTLNISKVTRRLTEEGFQPNQETDYVEFSALIALLDIAVDDGRNVNLDLKDKAVAEGFDEQVELLIKVLSHIHAGIGNPGAAYISRIEAKEMLDVVKQRFSDTLRARPKAKISHFNKPAEKVELLGRERAGMSAFLARSKA